MAEKGQFIENGSEMQRKQLDQLRLAFALFETHFGFLCLTEAQLQ